MKSLRSTGSNRSPTYDQELCTVITELFAESLDTPRICEERVLVS